MKRGRDRDSGMTLVELLVAMGLAVVLIGVLGSALIAGLRGARATADALANSADAQSLSSYFPQDVQSVSQEGDVSIASGAASGCSNAPVAGESNLVRLQWSSDTATRALTNNAAYRIAADPAPTGTTAARWRLTRYFCTSGGAASVTVVARNLANPATFVPEVAVNATGVRLTLTDIATDGSTYAFSLSGRYRVVTAGPGGPPPPPPPPPPVADVTLVTATLRDDAPAVRDGRADSIALSFDAEPQASCSAGWTISGLPGNGGNRYTAAVPPVLAPGTTTGSWAIQTVGNPAFFTAPGAMKISFAPTGTCTLLGFTAKAVLDGAGPVLIDVNTTVKGAEEGLLEPADAIELVFTENVALKAGTPTTGLTVLEKTVLSGNDALSIPGLTRTDADLGSTTYVVAGKTVSAPGSTLTTSTTRITATIGSVTNPADRQTRPDNPGKGSGGGPSTISLTPSDNVVDVSGNAAADAPRVETGFRAF